MTGNKPSDFVFALTKFTASSVPGHPVVYEVYIAHKDGLTDADGRPFPAPVLPNDACLESPGCYLLAKMPEDPMKVIGALFDLGYGWTEEFQKKSEVDSADGGWATTDNPDSMIEEIKHYIKWRTVQGMRKSLVSENTSRRKPPRLG